MGLIKRSKNVWERTEFRRQGGDITLVRSDQGMSLSIFKTIYSYVVIGKNASTWMQEFFNMAGELKYGKYGPAVVAPYNYNIKQFGILPQKFIVILRDPVERWCSGITEFLVNKAKFREGVEESFTLSDRETLDLLFGHVQFDWHTIPQVDFLDGLDTDQCIFFRLDQDFENTMKRFTEKELKIDTSKVILRPNSYNTAERESHSSIRKVIDFEIQTNPRYLDQIKAHYAMDIKLFNSVKFYE